MEAQWTTRCPHCGSKNRLIVTSILLTAIGKMLHPNTPLTGDGFETDPDNKYPDLKDHSTDQEKVRCECCNKKFNLADLSLDDQRTARVFWQDRSLTIAGGKGVCVNISTPCISNLRLTPQDAEDLYEALGKALEER